MITISDILPPDWRDLIAPVGSIGLGLDVATTAKKKSNPSAVTLIQMRGTDFIARLVVRFKTADPAVTETILRELLALPHGLKVRRLCVDATSEKFFCANLKKALGGLVVVDGVVNSETLVFRGAKMSYKDYLANMLINTIEDGRLLLPQAKWLEKDLRQTKRNGGSFESDVDAEGNHADATRSLELGLHAVQQPGGRAEASAAAVGGLGQPARQRWWKNPLARIGIGHRNFS